MKQTLKSKPTIKDIDEFKKAIYTLDYRMIKSFFDQGFPTDTASLPGMWEDASNELLALLYNDIHVRTLNVFYLLLEHGVNIHHKDYHENNALVYIFDFLYQLKNDEDFQEYSDEMKRSIYAPSKEMFDVLMQQKISLKLGSVSGEITDIFDWAISIGAYSWFEPYKNNFTEEELNLYEGKRLKNLIACTFTH